MLIEHFRQNDCQNDIKKRGATFTETSCEITYPNFSNNTL